jgi:hypothetical protein
MLQTAACFEIENHIDLRMWDKLRFCTDVIASEMSSVREIHSIALIYLKISPNDSELYTKKSVLHQPDSLARRVV